MLIFDQLQKNDPHLRLLAQIVFAGMVVLLAGLWWVQVVSYRDYQAHQETQSFRTVRIPAVRGKILDRNGTVLAESRPDYNVSLYLEDLQKNFDSAYAREVTTVRSNLNARLVIEQKRLGRKLTAEERKSFFLTSAQKEAIRAHARNEIAAGLVDEVGDQLKTPLELDSKKFERHYNAQLALPYPILASLTPIQLARFEEQPLTLAGVDLELQAERYYPLKTTAAHLLGHLRFDDTSRKNEDADFDYRLPDYRGAVGIEYGYDSELRGRAGTKSVLINSLGYRQTENIWSPVEPGKNLVLTIDAKLQQTAEDALRRLGPFGANTKGAVVVMDVNTGDVLVLASSPVFDPNDYIQGFTPAEYAKMQESGAEHNRATQENYAPGSIFKPIVGLACLEAGLDPNATIYNPGYIFVGRRRINDLAAPGNYDLRQAIMHSCNTYFITNGMKAGIENIIKLGQRLHLGEPMGLPTRQETAGYFPTLKQIRSGWFDGDSANLCIGQGYIAVTPLQMAVMTAALANGGKVLWPRLVDRIENQFPNPDESSTVFPNGKVRDHLGVSQRNLQILKDDMLAEVENGGTGARAEVAGLKICGKTGTAEITDDRGRKVGKNTWFISYAPYASPRYAVVVMVESGNFGGTTCAPIAAEIYEAIQKMESGAQSRNVAVTR